MSYAFPDIDPNSTGTVRSVQVPLMRYLEESYNTGEHYTVMNAMARMGDISVAEADQGSPILDTEIANKRYGIGGLKFTEPVRESVARVMSQRRKDQMDREFFLQHGATGARIIPGFAAQMLGGMSNPIDFGLMFIPFVGEEAVAAKAGTAVGRVLARRLITRETLREIAPRAPALTESMINGVVGQTMFEIPNLVASAKDGENYGMEQAAINILAGGGFAAAMHGAMRIMNGVSQGTQNLMARQALSQLLEDAQIKVHELVGLDEAAIRAEVAKEIPFEARTPEESKIWAQLVEDEVKRRSDEFIANARARIENEMRGKPDPETRAERDAQVDAGKTLSDEEVQRSLPPERFDEVAEESLGLEMTPAESASIKAIKPQTKAIDAAIDCIAKNLI